jgi:hypothetical protein
MWLSEPYTILLWMCVNFTLPRKLGWVCPPEVLDTLSSTIKWRGRTLQGNPHTAPSLSLSLKFSGDSPGSVVFDASGPLTCDRAIRIQTPKGVTKIVPEEWYTLKGLSRGLTPPPRHLDVVLHHPSSFVWSEIEHIMFPGQAPKELVYECVGLNVGGAAV